MLLHTLHCTRCMQHGKRKLTRIVQVAKGQAALTVLQACAAPAVHTGTREEKE